MCHGSAINKKIINPKIKFTGLNISFKVFVIRQYKNITTAGIAIAKIPLARKPKPAKVQKPHQQYFFKLSFVKKLINAQYSELVINTVSTISKIATCDKIKKNVLESRIIELYSPNFLDRIFLPKKYVKNTRKADNIAIGNLTTNGENVPNILIEIATSQK